MGFGKVDKAMRRPAPQRDARRTQQRTGQRPTGQNRPDRHGEVRTSSGRQWRTVIAQSLRDLWVGSAIEWAAALAFYAVLSLFPLFITGMILASFVFDVDWATRQASDFLGLFLPSGREEIETIVTAAIAERGRVGILSLIVFLVAGRRILGALTKGLNHVSDVDEQEDKVRRRAVVELALVVGLIAFGLLALAVQPLIDRGRGPLRAMPGPDGLLLEIVSGSFRAVLLLLIFTLIYAFVPQGQRLWRAVLIGAAVATALFLLAQGVFAGLGNIVWDNLRLLYGPLATAALLLSWAWYVALITLAGGALASHVKVMILEDDTAREAAQRHTGR